MALSSIYHAVIVPAGGGAGHILRKDLRALLHAGLDLDIVVVLNADLDLHGIEALGDRLVGVRQLDGIVGHAVRLEIDDRSARAVLKSHRAHGLNGQNKAVVALAGGEVIVDVAVDLQRTVRIIRLNGEGIGRDTVIHAAREAHGADRAEAGKAVRRDRATESR